MKISVITIDVAEAFECYADVLSEYAISALGMALNEKLFNNTADILIYGSAMLRALESPVSILVEVGIPPERAYEAYDEAYRTLYKLIFHKKPMGEIVHSVVNINSVLYIVHEDS